ncbi:MAG: hypothetical protein RR949_05855, partial [Oscillospiraceae bacterium]
MIEVLEPHSNYFAGRERQVLFIALEPEALCKPRLRNGTNGRPACVGKGNRAGRHLIDRKQIPVGAG